MIGMLVNCSRVPAGECEGSSDCASGWLEGGCRRNSLFIYQGHFSQGVMRGAASSCAGLVTDFVLCSGLGSDASRGGSFPRPGAGYRNIE